MFQVSGADMNYMILYHMNCHLLTLRYITGLSYIFKNNDFKFSCLMQILYIVLVVKIYLIKAKNLDLILGQFHPIPLSPRFNH